MKEKTDKLITLLGLGIAVVCTLLTILFAVNNGGVKELSAVKANGLFDATYWILVCFVVVSIAAIIFFLVVKLANRFKEDPGYLKKFLMLVGIVIVVLIVSYLLSKGDDVTLALREKNNISLGTSKLIGAACWMVYILVIGSAVAIIYTEVAKLIKKK
ncbi:MAG: hypothetical protein IK010_01845 [Bacteroidales bacterium]|nr:hypothetical protein [Bacteroidales bacterium]MBR4773155.1 hypothetical protein [Bacteroidales bacterium]MBR5092228.1 hypothetical protein [Bacteroidales bacterium]